MFCVLSVKWTVGGNIVHEMDAVAVTVTTGHVCPASFPEAAVASAQKIFTESDYMFNVCDVLKVWKISRW